MTQRRTLISPHSFGARLLLDCERGLAMSFPGLPEVAMLPPQAAWWAVGANLALIAAVLAALS
jgi:hypothetical protein